MTALQRQIDARERSETKRARSNRWRRRVGATITVAAVCTTVLLRVDLEALPFRDTARPAPDRVFGDVTVETAEFRFEIAGEPAVESWVQDEYGITMNGTQWTVEREGVVLAVTAIQLPWVLDQAAADGSFDGQLGGAARRFGGTLTVNETIDTGDAIRGRRGEIEVDGFRVYVQIFARGEWSVMVMSSNASMQPPPEYASLVASFVWLD
jgi:hypothetical protein